MAKTNILNDLKRNKIIPPQVESYLRMMIDMKQPGIITGPRKTTILDSIIYLHNTFTRTPLMFVIQDEYEIKDREDARVLTHLREYNDDGRMEPPQWISRAIHSMPNAILCGQMRLNSDEARELENMFGTNVSIISSLHGNGGHKAISKLKPRKHSKNWRWTLSTKKANNKMGFVN